MKKYIPIVLGTAREGNQSEKVAQFILAQAKESGELETEIIDVKEFSSSRTIPPWEESEVADRWRSVATRADAFIFIIPEYNHGYPGEFKILLDCAGNEYIGKKAALCGVSSGGFGGARVIENILPVLIALGLHTVMPALNFSKVEELFDGNGAIKEGSYNEKAKKLISLLQ